MNVSYAMVVVYVVRPAGDGTSHEFLQLRRRGDDYMGGTWQTVTGAAEDGETAVGAALRELHEETGLVPGEFYKLSTMEHFYLVHNETTYHVPSFCAVVPRGAEPVLNEEHDAHRWVGRGEVMSAFMWPSQKPVVEEVCREILDEGVTKKYLRISV